MRYGFVRTDGLVTSLECCIRIVQNSSTCVVIMLALVYTIVLRTTTLRRRRETRCRLQKLKLRIAFCEARGCLRVEAPSRVFFASSTRAQR